MLKTYKEKILKTINNRIYSKNWFPILAKNVQAYISFKIDVWMIYFGFTLHLRWFMWIIGTNLK